MNPLLQIFFNIVGGIIVAVLTTVYLGLRKKYFRYNFKRIFGGDAQDNFFIIYGVMKLLPAFDKNGDSIKWPYFKPGTSGLFNVSTPISFTGTKSAKYLSESFSKTLGNASKLISDEEVKEKLDISFCSIGGLNNLKTIDILESNENTFFEFNLTLPASIIVKNSQKKFSIDGTYDFGMILKIIPESFPNRVWIAVAGLGEWGTSGAAWFLSKNWKKIKKIAKNKSFGLIIRTKGGKDESAEIVYQSVIN